MKIKIVLQKIGERFMHADFETTKIENLIIPKDERDTFKKAIVFKFEQHLENAFNEMDNLLMRSEKQNTSNRMPEYESEDVVIEMDNLLIQLENAINKKKWGLAEITMETIDLIIEDKRITEAQAAKAAFLSIKAVKEIENYITKGK